MNIFRLILSIIIIAVPIYALITGTTGAILPYLLLLVGLTLIVTGVIEFQKRKAGALNLFLVSGFVLFVAVYTM
ncbi:DUF3953 domain-containing protein [Virgibacillus sp. CBA3643]|uniref:DUF3953 domain-containing protein n=1 Tax=Virgibacillus sp. CBA3643 TaxID=2942278 RepID=UPI0035A3D44B